MLNNKNKALLFLFFFWILVNVLTFFPPSIFSVPGLQAITEVQYSSNSNKTPDGLDDVHWKDISLPDSWYERHQNRQQFWYQANIQIKDLSDDVWAIYLPSVTHNAAVYINGFWVGQGGSFDEPLSRHHNEPLLFSFSSKLLQKGNNRINIRVKTTFHEQGFLDNFYFAPRAQLYDAYRWKYFVRVEVIEWLSVAMYSMAIILFFFWLIRPKDSVYGIFSLELFFWASHNLNLIVNNIPVSTRLWEAMTITTFGWSIVTMIVFNHRYIGIINIKVEKVMLLFAALSCALFFFPDVDSILIIGYRFWDSFLMIFGIYAIYYLLMAYRQDAHRDTYLMLLAGIPILTFGFHDILVINHLQNRQDGLIIQYTMIPVGIVFGWFLIRRFVESLNHSEHLTASLSDQVLKKQQELQVQYDKSVVLEKQQLLADERARMMRDIHDGIGGQLVVILSILQEHNGQIINNVREKIQHSLTDLRIVIDSLDPLLNDLPTLLGVMRMRLTEQLSAADINLEWAVVEVPEIMNMSPQHGLHIMRIVQEAITNSIKHAETKEMKVVTGFLDAQQKIFVDIIDYGGGISDDSNNIVKHGRGIKNMHYRAQQLGATLHINSSKEGTHIRLLMVSII